MRTDNPSFTKWTEAVKAGFEERTSGAQWPDIDEEVAYETWKSGTSAQAFAVFLASSVDLRELTHFTVWLDEVSQLLRARSASVTIARIQTEFLKDMWQARMTPQSFVGTADITSHMVANPVSQRTPRTISAPTSYAYAQDQTSRSSNLVAWIWILTAIVMLLGLLGSYNYSRGNMETVKFLAYTALVVDVPACILALVALAGNNTIVHGLCKLGWELIVGLSVFFLVQGINKSVHGLSSDAYSEGAESGYSQGTSSGYSAGYRDGFNAGAREQLERDRATLRGYGY